MINVNIKELPARRLAVIEHYGDPKKIGETVSKLIAWALWKAIFELCQITDKNSPEAQVQKKIIDEVME